MIYKIKAFPSLFASAYRRLNCAWGIGSVNNHTKIILCTKCDLYLDKVEFSYFYSFSYAHKRHCDLCVKKGENESDFAEKLLNQKIRNEGKQSTLKKPQKKLSKTEYARQKRRIRARIEVLQEVNDLDLY